MKSLKKLLMKRKNIKENIKNTKSINEVDTENTALNKENNQVTEL